MAWSHLPPIKSGLRAMDHAKLARFEMRPNAYHQHHQCPRTRLRSPSTAGFGTGDTTVTGLGTDWLVPFFATASGTDGSSWKRVGALLRLSACAGSKLSIFLRGAQSAQSSFLQSHTISHVVPSVGFFAFLRCSAACLSTSFAFFPPFGFFGAIVCH